MNRNDLGRPNYQTMQNFGTDLDTRRARFKDYRISDSGMSPDLINDTPNKPSTITWTAANITGTSTIQSDGSVIPGFSITVPTSAMTIKGAYYNIEMKLSTDTWDTNQSFEIYQPTSGDPVLIVSPVIGGSTYNFRVRGVSSLGTVGEWSNEISKDAVGDTSAPSTPTGLTATGLIQSIMLEWTANTELDLRYYRIYRGLTSTPTTLKASTNSTRFIDTDVTADTTYYYRIKAIDYSGNASGYSSAVSAAASKTMADDLAKTMQPFTSNIAFSPASGYETSKVSWGSGTIAFADGTTQAINSGTSTTLSAGTVYYLYFTLGSATLTLTSTYSDCVSDTKALICIVAVATSSASMGIFPVSSKLPLVNADMIAANSILALHIKAGEITADKILTVGSNSTSGARFKISQSAMRVYNSSSSTDENYYAMELDTNGLKGYTWASSVSKTAKFELTNTGTLKINANDVLQMWYSATQIGHIFVDGSGVALAGESGKVADLLGPGGCRIESTGGNIDIIGRTILMRSVSGYHNNIATYQGYNITFQRYYLSGSTVYPTTMASFETTSSSALFKIGDGTTFILGTSPDTTAGAIYLSGNNILYRDSSGTERTLTGTT